MRYLKLFENFIQSGGDTQKPGWAPSTTTTQKPGWAPQPPPGKPGQRFEFENIEGTDLYEEVLFAVESKMSEPIFAQKFAELERLLSKVDEMKMEAIFENEWDSSEFLNSELSKYNESIDLNKFAKEALIYLASIGAIALAVKLFYMLGSYTFQQLDQAGFSSVGGGVVLILIYLAFFHKVKKKNVQIEEEEEDDDVKNPPLLEKRTKKEGEENLRSTSFAYVPDKDKPSTWKLRIDDATHTKAAVAALGKGFRGNKVRIPSEEKESVIRKVRAAYKKFYPEIVKEEGYPKALELQ